MKSDRVVGLDALRGVAAAAIVLLHGMNLFHAPRLLHHAYLAVDFFFMLSGFVLVHAYQARLHAGLRPNVFMLTRLIRLYPLIVAGVLLGIFAAAVRGLAPAQIAREAGMALLMMPQYPDITLNPTLFPINTPIWSLFWELIASAAFAATLFRWRMAALLVAQVIALAVLVERGWTHGTLEIGFTWLQFPDGGIRTAFAFVTGLILRRTISGRDMQTKTSIALPALVLVTVLAGYNDDHAWLYDIGAVAVVFPLIIAAGARVGTVSRGWRLAGELSYPLYIVHLPVLSVTALWLARFHGIHPFAGIAIGAYFALVIAHLAQHLWDAPLRKRFTTTTQRKKEGGPDLRQSPSR